MIAIITECARVWWPAAAIVTAFFALTCVCSAFTRN